MCESQPNARRPPASRTASAMALQFGSLPALSTPMVKFVRAATVNDCPYACCCCWLYSAKRRYQHSTHRLHTSYFCICRAMPVSSRRYSGTSADNRVGAVRISSTPAPMANLQRAAPSASHRAATAQWHNPLVRCYPSARHARWPRASADVNRCSPPAGLATGDTRCSP